MTSTTKLILFVALVLVVGVAVGGWLVIRHGFSARSNPSGMEALLARTVRQLGIPADASSMKNPVPLTPEVLDEAMAHYADHCAFCHGNDGSGDTPIGKGLYPKPPDLRQADTQKFTDGELFYVIHNGVVLTGMPAFGEEDGPDMDSWKLVHFIRHLPNLTFDELERMKDLNPKTPEDLREDEEARKFLEGASDSADNNKPKELKHH